MTEDWLPPLLMASAVSSVVGRSIRRWIWMPSPGPMWEMWLKLDGAEMSFERRSGLVLENAIDNISKKGAE